MSNSDRPLTYRPEIDGLRAVAVIPVVLFHMGCSWVKGGYLGVDVFFVISGFLITSLVIRELEQGSFTISAFWLRRIRRIFPALAVMLIVTSLAGAFVFSGSDFYSLGRTGIAALLSFANIALWRLTNGYWGATAETFPLLHTWSLSVEEQFYFVYPFFLAFLFRFARRWIVFALSFVALVSFAGYFYGSTHHPTATFYLLPTRAWELASGCLLSIAEWKGTAKPRSSSLLSLVGLGAVGASYYFLSKDHAFPGALGIVIAGAVLIIAFATDRNGLVYRLLASRPAVFIGKISYSLYLWHWPVLVLVNNHNAATGAPIPNWVTLPLILAASLASYYFVEQTTRHRRQILRPAAIGFILSGATSCLIIAQNSTLDLSVYSPVVWNGRLYDVTPNQEQWTGWIKERMAGIQSPMRDSSAKDAYKTTGVLRKYGTNGIDVVVLGDSHALMWAGVLDEIAQNVGLNISFFTADGMSPFDPTDKRMLKRTGWSAEDATAFDRARHTRLIEWKPKLVMVLTAWSGHTNVSETSRLFETLGQLGCRVMSIEQPPFLFFGDKNTPREILKFGIKPEVGVNHYLRCLSGEHGKDYALGKKVVTDLEARYPFFSYVRINDLFQSKDSRALVLEGTRVLYVDDDHLSHDGASKAKQRIQLAIQCELLKWAQKSGERGAGYPETGSSHP